MTDAKSRTAWELATHLAHADIWFMDSVLSGAFVWNPDAVKQAESEFKTVDDIVAFVGGGRAVGGAGPTSHNEPHVTRNPR